MAVESALVNAAILRVAEQRPHCWSFIESAPKRWNSGKLHLPYVKLHTSMLKNSTVCDDLHHATPAAPALAEHDHHPW